MAVQALAGGYLKLWLLSMGSVFLMLFVAMIVAQVADESTIVLFILVYDGSVGLFIILTMLPIGAGVILFVLLYNGFIPIMQPMMQTILDIFVPIFSGIFVNIGVIDAQVAAHPIAPASLDVMEFVNALTGFMHAFTDFLLSNSGIVKSEFVG